MSKKKIVHLIVGLGSGGAEMMLYKLCSNLVLSDYDVTVISMMNRGVLGDLLEEKGIKVHTLNMKRGQISLYVIKEAIKICRGADIVQTWMYHADLLGYIISLFCPNFDLIWGIRHTNLNKDENKKKTLLIARINSHISKRSKRVKRIVSCSVAAKDSHIRFGYNKELFQVIPNGFELEEFKRINNARSILNDEFKNIDIYEKKIVTLIGRWNIQKDHNNFLEAMKIVNDRLDNILILMAGTNIDYGNSELNLLIKNKDLSRNVILLGRRADIPIILSASDIFVSSSSGEGFSNVIGEAMACEIPCVVTDVGDSAYIVGSLGRVVNAKQPKELANQIIHILELEETTRRSIGKDSRSRIMSLFNIKNVVSKYEQVYTHIMNKG